jgi:very-short-patch-repair endonuclease
MSIIPFRNDLKEKARALRNDSAPAEILLWTRLSSKQLGFSFKRQKPIANYIVDFVCMKKKLIIEIDGDSHNDKMDYDAKRDVVLKKFGFFVFHVTDQEVLSDLDGVCEQIYALLTDTI